MVTKKILIITESTNRGTDKTLLELIIKKHKPFGDVDVKFIFGGKPGGITDVLSRIKDLPVASEITGQDKPDVFIVIVDADDNPQKRYKEILGNFDSKIFATGKKVGEFGKEDGKIKTGIFLFPNSSDTGSLETLCYEAVNVEGIEGKKDCIQKYLSCLQKKSIDKDMSQNNISKAKFRILNATPEPDYNYVKNATKNLDLNHDCFKPLIDFLKKAVQ